MYEKVLIHSHFFFFFFCYFKAGLTGSDRVPYFHRKYIAMQQISLIYPIFDQFISFRFSFEKSYRENRLKALQLQEQVFFNKENFPRR